MQKLQKNFQWYKGGAINTLSMKMLNSKKWITSKEGFNFKGFNWPVSVPLKMLNKHCNTKDFSCWVAFKRDCRWSITVAAHFCLPKNVLRL